MHDGPISVGLVGAGPWASMVHAPVLAAGPETRLAGVWARRHEAAEQLAAQHHVPACGRIQELFELCEAVAFAVPPDVQADLAAAAAREGKSVLLEKPIAADLGGAELLTDIVETAGVASMVVLSWRYATAVRAFLEQVEAFDPMGGRGAFVSGALLGGPFATPWRLERGALLDLGPHVIDLLDAALGRVVGVRAHGSSLGWLGLLLDHDTGCASEASLCATAAVDPHRARVELFGQSGTLEIDCTAVVDADAFATLRREFAAAVRGTSHPLDVVRGLHLQRVIAEAEMQLASE